MSIAAGRAMRLLLNTMHLRRGPSPAVRSILCAASHRTRRASTASGGSARASGKPRHRKKELLDLPGVGPANAAKLEEAGYATVDSLRRMLRECQNDKDLMAQRLQSEVGIRHKTHCANIAQHVLQLGSSASRCTLSIEGNISAGKSTFLKIINDHNVSMEFQSILEVVPEPVEKWQRAGRDGEINLLDTFYSDPERYSYLFQNYVFVTRLLQESDSGHDNSKALRLLERSVFSDRMVFVNAVHAAGWMSDTEVSIYDSWFNPLLEIHPTLVPHGFIYLRASPDTCYRRLQMRARDEEVGVSLKYLQDLHDLHESWLSGAGLTAPPAAVRPQRNLLFPLEQAQPLRTLSGTDLGTNFHVQGLLDPLELQLPAIPPELEGRVLLLDKKQNKDIPQQLHRVPALYIDCDQDIDLEKDLDAKQHMVGQVKAFFKWMQAFHANRTLAAISNATASPRELQRRGNLTPELQRRAHHILCR